jgi:AcrR family transcriptional regulator
MAEIAAEAGMASGAIYTYVESKEALFHHVIETGFGPIAEVFPTLPLPTPAPGATLATARDGLRKAADTPLLRAALDEPEPADVRAELAAVVEERYAMIERFWPVLAVLERSAADVPGLEKLYFGRSRQAHFNELTRYLDRRAASGHLRITPDPSIASRIVSETIVWFAWHRHQDRDSALYDDELAQRSVVDFVVDAFVPAGGAPAAGRGRTATRSSRTKRTLT